MITFCFLVAPFPYKIKKTLFTFLSESPIVAKVAYALKISFMFVFPGLSLSTPKPNVTLRFVAILFADALQRMLRAQSETELAKHTGPQDVRTETNFAARKF